MPTPTTLEEMFDMPKRKITFGGKIYDINLQLKLKPWMPPVVCVWAGDEPTDLKPAHRKLWWELRGLLNELYAEHLRRNDSGKPE